MADELQSIGGINGSSVGIIKTIARDGKVDNNTALYTVPDGKKVYLLFVIVRLVEVSAFVSAPTVGFATLPNNDNLFTNAELTGLNTVNEFFKFMNAQGTVLASGTSVYMDTPIVADAATYNIEIDLIGYVK